LKNVFLFQFEELKKNSRGRKRIINGGQKGIFKNCMTPVSTIGEGRRTEEEFGFS
jgi:hypothetical protein